MPTAGARYRSAFGNSLRLKSNSMPSEWYYEEIVRLRPQLISIVRKRAGSLERDEREDVVGQTVLDVVHRLRASRRPLWVVQLVLKQDVEALHRLVFRVLSRRISDAFRREYRKRRMIESSQLSEVGGTDAADVETSPREVLDRLCSAIDRLPSRDRELLYSRLEEAAETMSPAERVRLHRIRARLRAIISG